jgi:hypothetical protein
VPRALSFSSFSGRSDLSADGAHHDHGVFVAVRLDALVVAILGMLGGFLTPILLSTGQDNPLGTLRLHRHPRRRPDSSH